MNINDYVLVRLTLAGLKQHSAYYHSLGLTESEFKKELFDQEVGDGRHRFSIRKWMHIFGSQMDSENPEEMFVDNHVVFVPANAKPNS